MSRGLLVDTSFAPSSKYPIIGPCAAHDEDTIDEANMARHGVLFWLVALALGGATWFPHAVASSQGSRRTCVADVDIDGPDTRLCFSGESFTGFQVKTLNKLEKHIVAPVEPKPLSPWPAWYKRGSCLSTGQMGAALFGIGCVKDPPETSPSELAALVENRALAVVLAMYEQVSALWHKCVGPLLNADSQRTGGKSAFSALALDFPSLLHSQVQIIDRWKNPLNGSVYALARVDLGFLEDYLKEVAGLVPADRQHVAACVSQFPESMLAPDGRSADSEHGLRLCARTGRVRFL